MNSSDVGLAWILSDHLGSTSKVIRASDYATRSETRYKPFGQARYVDGVAPTQHGFTGQIDEPELWITFFQSRWYDSWLDDSSLPVRSCWGGKQLSVGPFVRTAQLFWGGVRTPKIINPYIRSGVAPDF